MEKNNFLKGDTNHYYYFKRYVDLYVILLIYIDDMLIAGPDMARIEDLKVRLSERFEMKDPGSANKILGMKIIRDRSSRTLKPSQKDL